MIDIQIENEQVLIIGLSIFAIIWFLSVGRIWFKTLIAGVNITHAQIVFMRLRNSPANLILTQITKARKGGVVIHQDDLEACYMGGGNIENIVNGLIFAKVEEIELTVKVAVQLDHKKKDIRAYLKTK